MREREGGGAAARPPGVDPGPPSIAEPMVNAWSTAGRVWIARQTMTASPPVVRMARPTAVKPIGDARSPWTAAKSVEAATQKKATNGSSLIKNPKSQLTILAVRPSWIGSSAKNVHHVTSAMVSRYPIGRTLLPSGRFARPYPGDVSAAQKRHPFPTAREVSWPIRWVYG